MAGELREQRPGHALDAEGEGRVFDGAFVADFSQHLHKGSGFFLGEALHHVVDGSRRVAQAGRRSQDMLRLGGVRQQCDFHICDPSFRRDRRGAGGKLPHVSLL